ncbi:TetR/AcrR family transcriptional regulator [Corynebacterium choanae]|uniref:HTH-type transcriptional repressor NicS n=1 Tax=Corynebacterium choanae TaxID=1862358 RepID=A0A3G6J7U7_9CORY|nr:TetR/AcrR family transcriptional regulator [Corynebacterium choanae]AZA14127.1 HTH-type transcriptional repressor NicS [Corynebacterium choanae]
MNRPLPDSDPLQVTPEDVVDIALVRFADRGFADTKLESIAQESGMTKRMIHYHFGDKRGLYLRTLMRAFQLLRPTEDALEIESAVPVDGIQQAVEALYDTVVNHPDACRLVVMESLHKWAELEGLSPLTDHSRVILALDRLLMLGQDAGAFRPGISALDVYTIILSLCTARIAIRDTYINLYSTNLSTEDNTAGLRALVVDTVLSFLTSNMHSSRVSYLVSDSPNPLHGSAASSSASVGIYDDHDGAGMVDFDPNLYGDEN